jgi:hypothetical protein
MRYKDKIRILRENKILKKVLFHVTGITCLVWFLIRVLPAPHRSQYPCQQVSKSVATGYIAFMGVMLYGTSAWLKHTKNKVAKLAPVATALALVCLLTTGGVYAYHHFQQENPSKEWVPIAKNPMGTPVGLNPGRVVWVWNPDATQRDLEGYWYEQENNDQDIINTMFTQGILGLTGEHSIDAAWASLFTYCNTQQGKNQQGYQNGEKIVIKINLNNCWNNYYILEDNDRDASPYTIKVLLHHLVDIVGVRQEDITIYDASRYISNWFYYRVYYESYPATNLVPEYPGINFVDAYGLATGRQKVEASTTKIYFADDTGLSRTLPVCVATADYLINMPLLKRHPINNGVTLSGKNLFGTWMEPVEDIHPYHESGMIMGNKAPQVDLLAHDQLGGKTLLYIGDGLYATKKDHSTIDYFTMYPFNNDWTNSLFFSQDPVAIDSVMYDFLHTEGTNPIEGSQNYLHQAAEPTPATYDPENDGIFLEKSLGVHEHWDTTTNIFSPNRYSGPGENGIDFIAMGQNDSSPAIIITTPLENQLYIAGREITTVPLTIILGKIMVNTKINGVSGAIDKVDFYIDNQKTGSTSQEPYTWLWEEPAFFTHTLRVTATYNEGDETLTSTMTLLKFF